MKGSVLSQVLLGTRLIGSKVRITLKNGSEIWKNGSETWEGIRPAAPCGPRAHARRASPSPLKGGEGLLSGWEYSWLSGLIATRSERVPALC